MEHDLWVKEVKDSALKPLDEWRDDLYGYWMVFSDVSYKDGEKMAIARYYGTDKLRLYELYDALHSDAEDLTVGIIQNKRSNWMGGVFLAKTES